MNALLWIAQVVLAGAFLIVGSAKIFAFKKLKKELETHPRRRIEMSRGMAALVGVLEIVGAIGVLLPPFLLPGNLAGDYLVVLSAAVLLALLMVAAGIYHLVRGEPASPAVALFLLALFVIVGRWPH